MPDRHIILRAIGPEWRAAYSDEPASEFAGTTPHAAIEALIAAKGRRDPKQSAAQIDIAEMLRRAEGLE